MDKIEPIVNPTKVPVDTKQTKRVDKVQHIITALDNLAVNKKKDLNDVIRKIKAKRDLKPEKKSIFIDNSIDESSDKIPTKSDLEVLEHARRAAEIICEWITENTRDYICSTGNEKHDDSDDDNDGEKAEYQIYGVSGLR